MSVDSKYVHLQLLRQKLKNKIEENKKAKNKATYQNSTAQFLLNMGEMLQNRNHSLSAGATNAGAASNAAPRIVESGSFEMSQLVGMQPGNASRELVEVFKQLNTRSPAFETLDLRVGEAAPKRKQFENMAKSIIQRINNRDTRPAYLSQEQCDKLIYILNSCIARINYNCVLLDFYKQQPDRVIHKHLESLMGFTLSPLDYGLMKTGSIFGQEGDIGLYFDLINLIHKNLESPELFDLIHEFSHKEAKKIKMDESGAEDSITGKRKAKLDRALELLKLYLTSQEYLAGRELPHIQEIEALAEPHLSKKYRTFKNYYSVEIFSQMHKFFHIPKGGDFLKEASVKAAKFEDELKTLQENELLKDLVKQDMITEALLTNAFSKLRETKELCKTCSTVNPNPRNTFDRVYDNCLLIQNNLLKIKRAIAAATRLQKASLEAPVKALEEAPEPDDSKNESDAKATLEQDAANSAGLDFTGRLIALEGANQSLAGPDLFEVPDDIKALVKSSLFQYSDSKENHSLDNKVAADKGLGNEHAKLLLKIICSDKEREQIFKQTNVSDVISGIKLGKLINLTKALGGKIVKAEGCRFRVLMDNQMGDIVTLPSLHRHHGGDVQNGIVSSMTVVLFANLFERAGVRERYQNELQQFVAKMGIKDNPFKASVKKP